MMLLLAKAWRVFAFPKKFQLVIMRMLQDEFLIGVTGVILNANNEILICKHTYRQGSQWGLPGGYIKSKESPKEGLVREIEEETGFIVRIDEEIKIRTDRETARLDISFIGRFIDGTFKQSDEVSEVRFFSFDNLPALPQNQLMLIKEALDRKANGVHREKKQTSSDKRLTFWEKTTKIFRKEVNN